MKKLIMAQDVVVATFDEHYALTIENEALCPLFIKNTGDVQGWLRTRAIDAHRPHSRILKRMLRLEEKDDVSTALKVNAATITDCFWVKSENSNERYADIVFSENIFDRVALYGDSSGFDLPPRRTPELTNIGSFEKCWKLNKENGSWYMIKQATLESAFSEVFISKLGIELHMNMAVYEPRVEGKTYSVISPNFVTHGNYQPASAIIPEDKDIDFDYNYHVFASFNPNIGMDYARILFMDAVCMNPDRHLENYGIITDYNTGEIVAMAPNFDNNMALLYNRIEAPSRGFLKDYKEFFETHPDVSLQLPSKAEFASATDRALQTTLNLFPADVEKTLDLEKISCFVKNSFDIVVCENHIEAFCTRYGDPNHEQNHER